MESELANLKEANDVLRQDLENLQKELAELKDSSSGSTSLIESLRLNEKEKCEILRKMKENVDDAQIQKLCAESQLESLFKICEPKENHVTRVVADSVWRIFHNMPGGKHDLPFEVVYTHPETVKVGDSFEVRIDDIGEKWSHAKHQFDIGIGLLEAAAVGGKNRTDFGFDIGTLSSDRKVLHLQPNDEREIRDCPDSVLIPGDVIHVDITENGIVAFKNKKGSSRYHYENCNCNEYNIVIGLNNRFEKVTLALNETFECLFSGPLQMFPKDDVRVYVASLNEGSPKYAAGVSKGGEHLLDDGMLLRRMRDDGRRIINYEPGFEANAYDAKIGGKFRLSDLLPNSLVRNRIKLSGNLVSVTRKGIDEFKVVVRSLLTAHEVTFNGSDADWAEQKDKLLSSGEKYLVQLPSPNGMIQTNDLIICGTKCKTISNVVYSTLTHKVEDTDKTPAVLLLGGDRSQSIGSISGAVRAYEDLCVVFFDAHFDFRDPNASEYPIVHGSPLFFLLQDNLREAIKEWNDLDTDAKNSRPETREAIDYIQSTREGRQYWEDLQNPSLGYRGFNWLHDAEKLNPHRLAFVGVRQTEQEIGSSLGSPLVTLFLQLLQLQKCMYPENVIRAEGVSKVFGRIIEQFRSTFPEDHIKAKDAAHPQGKWIPPIMVSWDVDSIDPKAMPCVIFQEPNGLTKEECLAISDEIASTKSLVLFETIEFNPDLWGGYRDEPIAWTINEFEAGPLNRLPREPEDKNKHRLDLQCSLNLLKDMIVRSFDPDLKCVES